MEAYSKTNRSRPRVFRYYFTKQTGTSLLKDSLFNADSTFSGFREPAWKALVRDHKPATTPATGNNRVLYPGYVDMARKTTQIPSGVVSTEQWYGSVWQPSEDYAAPSLPTTSMDNDALTKFYVDANSVIRRASGMLVLAELHKTVHQLKHPLSALTKLLSKREIRLKGKWNRVHKTRSVKDRKIALRDLKHASADTWLEVQFGLKPLVSDIEDIVKYLQFRRNEIGVEYYPIRGASRSFSQSTSRVLDQLTTNQGFYYNINDVTRKKVRYIGELKVDPLCKDWSVWDASRLGLSLRQFLPTLWEITPWSFLIDYFASVGGLIDSFNVPRSQVVWYNKTVRSARRVTKTYTGEGTSQNLGFQVTVPLYCHQSSPGELKTEQFQRTGQAGVFLPRPEISFDLPSGHRIANIVALAFSNSRSRFSNPL